MHPMFIAVLLTITKVWKGPKCPLTDEWIKKMLCVCVCVCVCVSVCTHTMEYYLAMKKNEILPFATMWMELEYILNEIRERHIY